MQAMQFGYTITGSNKDGINLPILRPGKINFYVGDSLPNGVTAATASVYSQESSSAKLLENPLWYAAKYGGFDTIDTDKKENPVIKPVNPGMWMKMAYPIHFLKRLT